MWRSLSGRGGHSQTDTRSRNTVQTNCRETDRRRGRQDEVSDGDRERERQEVKQIDLGIKNQGRDR